MSNDKSSASGGIGFCGALTIAFIVLKLCNVINWSWWWVLSPLWIPLSLVIIGFGFWALWYAFIKVPDERKRIAAGMSEIGWKMKKKNKPFVEPKSKWQQRMEEVQKQRTPKP